MFPDLQLQAAG